MLNFSTKNSLLFNSNKNLSKLNMKNLIVLAGILLMFLAPTILLAQADVAKSAKEEKSYANQQKTLEKARVLEEKRQIANQKAEEKRIKNLNAAQKSYDKALSKRHQAEISLAKEKLAYEKARQKGKGTEVDFSKRDMKIKQMEIKVQQLDGEVAKFQRDINRYSPKAD
jgi:hypothetical protein